MRWLVLVLMAGELRGGWVGVELGSMSTLRHRRFDGLGAAPQKVPLVSELSDFISLMRWHSYDDPP